MLTQKSNIHHSKLPAIGAIVEVHTRALQPGHRYARYIVEAYNLCDSADFRYSHGIHLVHIALLANRNERHIVSGHWCEEIG